MPKNFLGWDNDNDSFLSWQNPERKKDGTRKDDLHEKSTKALGPSAPGHGMMEPVDMIENSVPLSWPQDKPLSWSRPERDAKGKRKDGLYERPTKALAPPTQKDPPFDMIKDSVPLSWPQDEPLSWNRPERDENGKRLDGLYENPTKTLWGPTPKEDPTPMIETPVPLSWPQDEPLSWNRPERDENGVRQDGLYEKSTKAMHGATPKDDPIDMIERSVPLSWPQDEPLSWNRPERDENGKRKDGLYEKDSELITDSVPLSWPQDEPLSWNRPERNEDGTRKDGLYEEGTQMIPDSIPMSWDVRHPISWDKEGMFVEDENLEGVDFVGIGKDGRK